MFVTTVTLKVGLKSLIVLVKKEVSIRNNHIIFNKANGQSLSQNINVSTLWHLKI